MTVIELKKALDRISHASNTWTIMGRDKRLIEGTGMFSLATNLLGDKIEGDFNIKTIQKSFTEVILAVTDEQKEYKMVVLKGTFSLLDNPDLVYHVAKSAITSYLHDTLIDLDDAKLSTRIRSNISNKKLVDILVDTFKMNEESTPDEYFGTKQDILSRLDSKKISRTEVVGAHNVAYNMSGVDVRYLLCNVGKYYIPRIYIHTMYVIVVIGILGMLIF